MQINGFRFKKFRIAFIRGGRCVSRLGTPEIPWKSFILVGSHWIFRLILECAVGLSSQETKTLPHGCRGCTTTGQQGCSNVNTEAFLISILSELQGDPSVRILHFPWNTFSLYIPWSKKHYSTWEDKFLQMFAFKIHLVMSKSGRAQLSQGFVKDGKFPRSIVQRHIEGTEWLHSSCNDDVILQELIIVQKKMWVWRKYIYIYICEKKVGEIESI